MDDLTTLFEQHTGRELIKWQHYFAIYERHLARFRGTDVHVVEFGVNQGGSLQLWKQYFGPAARIWGVDINPHCRRVAEDQIEVLVADQDDRASLQTVVEAVPRIDVLIDDGGHRMRQQIATFEVCFPHLSSDGVYLCEDLHTSYLRPWQGGLGRAGTFIEYSKRFIDELHAWHYRETVSEFTRGVDALHYYDSVLVIEKRPRTAPYTVSAGTAEVPPYEPPRTPWQQLRRRVKRLLLRRPPEGPGDHGAG